MINTCIYEPFSRCVCVCMGQITDHVVALYIALVNGAGQVSGRWRMASDHSSTPKPETRGNGKNRQMGGGTSDFLYGITGIFVWKNSLYSSLTRLKDFTVDVSSCFIWCGRLNWLPVSFLLHVKYTVRLSYRTVSYYSNRRVGLQL